MIEDNQHGNIKSSTSDDDGFFMDRALYEAAEAERQGEVPIGAVIVHEGEVIATGRNEPIGTNDPTSHAEIQAIRRAAVLFNNYRLPGCTLYVTLEPCAMCAGAMIQTRIQRLVFGCSDPKAGAAGSLYNIPQDDRLNHRIEVSSGVRSRESREQLRDFFKRQRSSS